tara:strand:+ start:2835 stop:3041 length:207 start_codon:yes stop_codon:yes gene_type:complete
MTILTITSRHGTDVYVCKDEPTDNQIAQLEEAWCKYHDENKNRVSIEWWLGPDEPPTMKKLISDHRAT